jgi:hypothetical protein
MYIELSHIGKLSDYPRQRVDVHLAAEYHNYAKYFKEKKCLTKGGQNLFY